MFEPAAGDPRRAFHPMSAKEVRRHLSFADVALEITVLRDRWLQSMIRTLEGHVKCLAALFGWARAGEHDVVDEEDKLTAPVRSRPATVSTPGMVAGAPT